MNITDQSKQVSNFSMGVSNEAVPISKKEVTPALFHIDSAIPVSPPHIFYCVCVSLICEVDFPYFLQWQQLKYPMDLQSVDSWSPGVR